MHIFNGLQINGEQNVNFVTCLTPKVELNRFLTTKINSTGTILRFSVLMNEDLTDCLQKKYLYIKCCKNQ